MAIRFNRRIKIAPGLTLNVGKRGVSASVGITGAKLTVGSNGVRRTIGLSGTGLYDTQKLSAPAPAPEPQNESDELSSLLLRPPQASQKEHLSFGKVIGILLLAGAFLLARYVIFAR